MDSCADIPKAKDIEFRSKIKLQDDLKEIIESIEWSARKTLKFNLITGIDK